MAADILPTPAAPAAAAGAPPAVPEPASAFSSPANDRPAKRPAARASEAEASGDSDGDDDDWAILDRARHVRRQFILLSGGAWTDRVTAGVWYGLPLAHEGILPHINDDIILDIGADYTWLHDSFESTHGLWLAVGPRWDFHLTRAWSLYAAFHVGFFITLETTPRNGPNFFQPGLGMGAMYRVSQRLQLALDLSYPQGMRFGVNFALDG